LQLSGGEDVRFSRFAGSGQVDDSEDPDHALPVAQRNAVNLDRQEFTGERSRDGREIRGRLAAEQ
jgi:hypothetical protein